MMRDAAIRGQARAPDWPGRRRREADAVELVDPDGNPILVDQDV
jgi:hypothetical protein